MDEGPIVAYFGYGSLVNRTTLRTQYIAAQPANLSGWRRCWRPRKADDPIDAEGQSSLLSARQESGHKIDGLLVYDTLSNLPAVDAREATYERVAVDLERLDTVGSVPVDCPIYVYEAHTNAASHDPGDPILQSYLDAVMQGFMHEFGETGVRDFLHSTDGFERPVRADRHDPVYPRAVELPDHQRAFFDELLIEKGVNFV
jgi:hypothetical protein